jgi:hypothetical protein
VDRATTLLLLKVPWRQTAHLSQIGLAVVKVAAGGVVLHVELRLPHVQATS